MPLYSLIFLVPMMPLGTELVRWVEGNLRKTECQVWTMHTISRTQPQTLTLTCLHMHKIGPHILCGFGRGKLCRWSVRSGEADVRKHFCPPLPTLTLNRLHYKSFSLFIVGRYPQAWSGLKACRGCGDIALPVLAPTSSRNSVTHGMDVFYTEQRPAFSAFS